MNFQRIFISKKEENRVINYNKNQLINTALEKYYDTFSRTLDTADFVPEKFNAKISKYIFKNMKKSFKKIDKEDKKYQKSVNKKLRLKNKAKKKADRKLKRELRKQQKPKKKGGFFYGIFHRKAKKDGK